MLFMKINRNLPERVFLNVYNADSVAITANLAACWKLGLTEATGAGVHVILAPATADLMYVAGFSTKGAIAVGAYGLIQIFGLALVKTYGVVTQGSHHVNTGGTTAGKCIGIALDSKSEASVGPCLTTALADDDGLTAGASDPGSCLAFLRLM